MKSPFRGLPDLLPELPAKSVRLTLSPEQALVLYSVLSKASEIYDRIAEDASKEGRADAARIRQVSDFVWELDGLLSDKLDFKAVA